MFKNFVIAAGGMLAATFVTCLPAAAHTHAARAHRGHALRVASGHTLRSHGSSRRRLAAGHIHSRWARRGISTRHGIVLAHRGFRHRGHRFAALRQDQAIRNAVGPASSYREVSSSGGGQVGGASYYGGRSHTASGGYVGAATCAHRSLPFGTRVLVTNLANARQAVLTVNDRGPFVRGRIVDVSVGAAGTLGMLHSGTARVSVQVVGGPG